MAEKTLMNAVQIRNGNPIEINVLSSIIGTEIDRYSRVINATLILKVAAITGATGFNVEARSVNEPKGTETPWEIIDFVSPSKKGDFVHLNITEEVNDIIKQSNEKVTIRIAEGVTFEQAVELKIEYIPERIMHESNVYYEVDAGRAGSGKINLATGGVAFVHGDCMGVSHIYNTWQAGETGADFNWGDFSPETKVALGKYGDYGCGNGWKLNLHQYLVKREGTDGHDFYTYVDGNGNYHEFAERYYYETNEGKQYINDKKTVSIDFDGKLSYNDGDKTNEVKIELKTTSGLSLQTDLSGFKGAEKLELRSEERARLDEEIINIERTISDCEFAKVEYKKAENSLYKALTEQQNQIEKDSAELERLGQNSHKLIAEIMGRYSGKNSADGLFSKKKDLERYLEKNADGTYINQLGKEYDQKLRDYKTKLGNYDTALTDYKSKQSDYNTKLKTFKNAQKENKKKQTTYENNQESYYDYLKTLNDTCYAVEEESLNGMNTDPAKGTTRATMQEKVNASFYLNLGQYSLNIAHLGVIRTQNDLSDAQNDLSDAQKAISDAQNDLSYAQKAISDAQNDLSDAQKKLSDTIDLIQQSIRTKSDRIEEINWDESEKLNSAKTSLLDLQDKFRVAKKNYNDAEEARQIARNNELYNRADSDLKKALILLESKKFELSRLTEREPVRFLTDTSGAILAFNESGALIAIADAFENVTYINYENGKIVSVTDKDNNKIGLEYNDGLLYSITDADDKVIRFRYDNGTLLRAEYADGTSSEFSYIGEFNQLHTVTNAAGYGIKISYDGKSVDKVEEFTNTYDISCNGLRGLESAEPQLLADIICKTRSTTLTDRHGNSKTYVFDILGKPVTIYEGTYYDPGLNTKSVSMEYNGVNKAFSIADNIGQDNLLEGLVVEEVVLDGGVTTERIKPYNVDIKKIPEGTTDLMLSAWAKADSAFIASERKTDYSYSEIDKDHLEYADEKKKRKFELRAVLEYDKGKPDIYSATYDWLNTEWQYLALPVTINLEDKTGDRLDRGTRFPFILGDEARKLVSLNVYLDYSYNTNSVEFDCVTLRQGKWKYSAFDMDGKQTYSEDDKGNTTKYHYDEKGNMVKAILTDSRYCKFTNTYEYNKQNQLVRSTDYNGLCEETVYDSKGRAVKSIKYNISDPTSKFYSESIRDEKGKITADVDITGEFNSAEYGFDHIGAVNVITDALGNKTAFGYHNDELVSLSASDNGEENKNEITRTLGYITKVSSGGTDYTYTYDGWGRQKEIKIAGELYCETDYADDYITKTTLGTGESIISHAAKKDDETVEKQLSNGKMFTCKTSQTSYNSADGANEEIVTNYYDEETGRLVYSQTDKNAEVVFSAEYNYDKEGRIVCRIEDGIGTIDQKVVYDDKGNINKTTYAVENSKWLEYRYKYDASPDSRLMGITLPNDVEQSVKYDGLGRTAGVATGALTKDIYYAKYGDHATNYVSSVWYGKGGAQDDNTRYTYDKRGNITCVKENGREVIKYAYDALGRLIREDNKLLMQSYTYEYDNNGNIISKIISSLESHNGAEKNRIEYSYSQSGWQDQLLSVKQINVGNAPLAVPQSQFTYDALGNPKTYRGKEMRWTKGRSLVEYNGNIYAYNASGIRTSKMRSDGTVITYYLDGNKIIAEERRNADNTVTDTLYYYYGVEGIAGFNHNGAEYLYRKNIQGDITHIFDCNGNCVVKYVYDAWGNCQAYAQKGYEELAERNPYRYRGYYYDTESGLYYLQSRYYDPEIGRFINADDISYLDPETINGLNLYAYCVNNPVMLSDSTGHSWLEDLWKGVWTGLTTVGGAIAGFFAGGPVGAAIGGALGFAFGSGTSGIFGQMLNNAASAVGNFYTQTVPDFFNRQWNAVTTGSAIWLNNQKNKWEQTKDWFFGTAFGTTINDIVGFSRSGGWKSYGNELLERVLRPAGRWLWNDILKSASQNPIVNGIIAIGGLALTIAGAIITAPIWGTAILTAGVVVGSLGVILWLRSLFD